MKVPLALEPPPSDALLRSQQLRRLIDAEIDAHAGWLPFSRYMELALYAPQLGYYTHGASPFGAVGDFTTAPETSALFARSIARQIAQVFDHTDRQIVELGPGSGVLAADLLAALESLDRLPECYALVDVSAPLRERQQQTLRERVPHLVSICRWQDQVPEHIKGVVLGNEVLDALPVDLVVCSAAAWLERGLVAGADGALIWSDRPVGASLKAALQAALPRDGLWPDGYATEISRRGAALVSAVATHLSQGIALFIDYGFPAEEFYHLQRNRGTLMAHFRHHAHGDVLRWPGLQDLTAHVDFSAIARHASEGGCTLAGYTSQARFLLNCGIVDLIESTPEDAARWLPQTNALSRLLSEAEMGELFKVIAFGRGVDCELLGFASGDRQERL